jgi:hypothetical protein
MVPDEFPIALPYRLTIAAILAGKGFNVPASLETAYIKEEK